MLEPLLSLKDSNKTILVVTGTRYSADVVFAALALYLMLKKAGLDCHLQSSNLMTSKIWKHKLSGIDTLNLNGLPPSRYTFKLPPGFMLKDISWQNDKEQILVKMDAQAFAKKIPPIKIETSPLEPDIIIYVGNNNGLTPEITGLSPKLLSKKEKLLILSRQVLFGEETIELKSLQDSKSFSFKTNILAQKMGLSITSEAATYLLAGIINHTDLFKKNINPQVFDTIKQLSNAGGDYQKAYHLAIKDMSLKKMQFLAELIKSTSLIAPGIYQSGLILGKPLKMRLEVSEMMKISEIYDCDMAIVSISNPVINRIYLKNQSSKYDLKQILKKLNGKGNRFQGVIESRGDIGQIQAQIYELLGIGMNKPVNRKS